MTQLNNSGVHRPPGPIRISPMNSLRLAHRALCELFSCYVLGRSKSGNDIGGQETPTTAAAITAVTTVVTPTVWITRSPGSGRPEVLHMRSHLILTTALERKRILRRPLFQMGKRGPGGANYCLRSQSQASNPARVQPDDQAQGALGQNGQSREQAHPRSDLGPAA